MAPACQLFGRRGESWVFDLSSFWGPAKSAEQLLRNLCDLIAHPFDHPWYGPHNAYAADQLWGQSAAGLEAFEVAARAAAANEPEA